MTGSRQETVLACEGKKAGLETHQVAIVLGDGRCQIVIPKFARDATQIVKGVNLTAHESFKALAMRELHIQLAAVALHQAEGIELAAVALVGKSAEMTPVDFETLSGCGLHAHIGTLGSRVAPHCMQVLFQDAETTVEAQGAKPLGNDHGAGLGILLQQFGDGGFKGIQLARRVAGERPCGPA